MTIHQISIFIENPSCTMTKVPNIPKNAGIQCTISDVFARELDNLPGKAADAVAIFSEAGISISYLYSFLLNGKGILIFRTDDNEKAKATIKANGLKYITEPKLPEMA